MTRRRLAGLRGDPEGNIVELQEIVSMFEVLSIELKKDNRVVTKVSNPTTER